MTGRTVSRQGGKAEPSGLGGASANGADPVTGLAADAATSVRPPRPSGRGATNGGPTAARTAKARVPFAERGRRLALAIVHRDSTVRRSLAVADIAALTSAIAIAAAIGGAAIRPVALAIAMVELVVAAKIMGLYDRDANVLHKSTLAEVPSLFHLSTLAALVIWLAGGSGGAAISGELAPRQVAVIWIALFALMALLRAAARWGVQRASPPERCLFVGDSDREAELRGKLATTRSVNAEIVARIEAADMAAGELTGGELAAELEPQIRALAVEYGAHRVVLAPGPGASEQLVNAIRGIKEMGLKVSVLPRHSRVAGPAMVLDHLNGITLLGVRRFQITKSSRVVKRAFDIVGASSALLIAAPLLAALAVAIRIDSPGPILFRQRRAGRDGRPFEMLKLRSMFDGAEHRQDELAHLNQAEGVFKLRDDPRITPVGRFMRRHSLDELPQLFNVLRGEMSLVGPRPLPLSEDSRIIGEQRRRLELRPGITGPWQVLGSTEVPLREMVNLDNQYVANWSLWEDARILLLTAGHVIGRRGL